MPRSRASPRSRGRDLITAVGDLDGDGRNDMVARRASAAASTSTAAAAGAASRRRSRSGTGWGGFTALAATGDLDGDGRADLLARDADGRMWLLPGLGGRRSAGRPVPLAGAGALRHHRWLRRLQRRRAPDLLAAETGGRRYLLPAAATAPSGIGSARSPRCAVPPRSPRAT